MNDIFSVWLRNEIERRGWSFSDLARKSGIPLPSISRILSGQRLPGSKVCRAIATALNQPADEVFRAAGLLPPEPEMVQKEKELIHLFRQLDTNRRDLIIEIVRLHLNTNLSDERLDVIV